MRGILDRYFPQITTLHMRTFDDIIPPSRRKLPDTPPSVVNAAPPAAPRRRFPLATLIVVLFVIAVSVSALWYFSGARIEIDPTVDPILVSGNFSADSSSTSTLPFQIISAQKVATQSVATSGSETVSTVAQGTITIYNQQPVVQKLIATTRFESANGLVYRIKSALSVPAAKGTTPGQVPATVFADQAGDSYNIPASSFTLPGLAGSAQAGKVYAKSTGAMTGGFSGTRPKVDVAAETTAQAALQTTLGTSLESALQAEVPQGYVLLPGASFISYTALPSAASQTTGQVDVREQGSAIGVVFPAASLASSVASGVLGAAYHGEPVTLTHIDTLTLASTEGVPKGDETMFNFSLSGNTTIVWTIVPSKIAAAVAGKSRDAAQVVLSGFPEVRKALLVLRPFWASNFPNDPNGITVVVNKPS